MNTGETKIIENILTGYEGKNGILIQLLLDIQQKLGWISPLAIQRIQDQMKIPLSKIYRTASFYKAMSLVPRGKYIIRVCLGTACHVRGGLKIMEKIEELLGIEEETGTTEDMEFTLERVNCLGCCALGPVVVINDRYYNNVTTAKIEKILKPLQSKGALDENI